jgi:peptidoglycan/xylan/chitin deacetylase (PgdA/CDA1 family)
MTAIYQPDRSLPAKIKRRLVPFQAQRLLPVKLKRPIVSFSFDDCPKSVIDNALKPIEAEGWQATVYIAMGLCGITNHLGLHMSADDVKAVHESGHEIGDHSFSHYDGSALPLDAFLADIDKNREAFDGLGLPAAETFAYPYGGTTPALKKALESRFIGARGINSRHHKTDVDLNQIGSNRLYKGASFDVLLTQISALKEAPAWMTIFTHDVRDNPSDFGCTPAQVKTVIKAVKDCGADVMTVAGTIKYLEAADV